MVLQVKHAAYQPLTASPFAKLVHEFCRFSMPLHVLFAQAEGDSSALQHRHYPILCNQNLLASCHGLPWRVASAVHLA